MLQKLGQKIFRQLRAHFSRHFIIIHESLNVVLWNFKERGLEVRNVRT